MRVNNEINNGECTKGGPHLHNKVDVKAKAKQAKEQICKQGRTPPYPVLDLINSTPTHFDFGIGFPTRANSRPSNLSSMHSIPTQPFSYKPKRVQQNLALKTHSFSRFPFPPTHNPPSFIHPFSRPN